MKKRKQLDKSLFRIRMRLSRELCFGTYLNERTTHYIESVMLSNGSCADIVSVIKMVIRSHK